MDFLNAELNVKLILFTTFGSLIATIITTLLKSYFSEKGKNLATKQDIDFITDKIESVKDSYNKSLENYRTELKKAYDLSKPSLGLTLDLDKKLIEKVSKLNTSIFEIAQLNNYDKVIQLFNEIEDLAQFCVKYRIRYANLEGVSEIIEMHNKSEKFKRGTSIDPNEIRTFFNKLSTSLDKLMGYFLEPIKQEKNNS